MQHSLRSRLVNFLAELEHNKLCGFERCKADQDIDDTIVDILLRCCRAIAQNEESVIRFAPLKRAGSKLCQHEGSYVESEASPQRFIIWLEDRPLYTVKDTYTQKNGSSPHWNIPP